MTYDVIIIGGGPGGLSAAIYCSRGGLNTLIIESAGTGGQVNYTYDIDNYPGFIGNGRDLAEKMYEQVKGLGIKIVHEKVLKLKNPNSPIKTAVTRKNEYSAPAVIISTGSKPRPLGIDGEERLRGAGVSYCATCDGAFFEGKTAAVVGGGNTAFEDALYLSKLCKKVYLIHRRDSFRANAHLVSLARKNPSIELILNTNITSILGKNIVEAVMLSSRFNEKKQILETDAVFVAAGRIPQTDLAENMLALTDDGYIITDENMRASIDGIYAVGDVRDTPLRQIVTAAADGAIAASDIIRTQN
ncbi:MAG: thioredoxin-disulfide reductase [Firmicutes bacterium]|nr:thioredoxin-disulfide reductase [Bacillota bacterium]